MKRKKITQQITLVMARVSLRTSRMIRNVDWAWRAILARIFLFFVYLEIDLELEAQSLQSNFVNSKAFVKAINEVFDECNINNNNTLDRGEFFSAILLLYHKLNRIPYTGRKTPPSRSDVNALFYKYVSIQTEAEIHCGLERSGELATVDTQLLKTLMQPESKNVKKPKLSPIVSKTIKRQQKIKRYFKIILRKMKAPGPYMAAAMFFVIFEVICMAFFALLNQPIQMKLAPLIIRALGTFASTAILLILYHTHEIHKADKARKTEQLSPQIRTLSKLRSGTSRPKKIRGKLRRDDGNVRARTSSLMREDFITRQVGNRVMRRETFIMICQTHFGSFVVSETWKVMWKALIIPLVAWKLKSILDYVLVVVVYWFNSIFILNTPVEAQPLPLSVVMSLTMAIFAFIIEPVSRSIIWSKIHETIKEDMRVEEIHQRRKHAMGENQLWKKLMTFLSTKTASKKSDGPIRASDKTAHEEIRSHKTSFQTQRKSRRDDAKDHVESMVGLDRWDSQDRRAPGSITLRKHTRMLNETERLQFEEYISSKIELEDE